MNLSKDEYTLVPNEKMIHYKEALENVEEGSFMITTAESRMYMGGSVTETIYVKDEEVKARLIKINNEWRMRLSDLRKELRDADDRSMINHIDSEYKKGILHKSSPKKEKVQSYAWITAISLIANATLLMHLFMFN
jgi:hypothetical protein